MTAIYLALHRCARPRRRARGVRPAEQIGEWRSASKKQMTTRPPAPDHAAAGRRNRIPRHRYPEETIRYQPGSSKPSGPEGKTRRSRSWLDLRSDSQRGLELRTAAMGQIGDADQRKPGSGQREPQPAGK